MEHRKRTAQSVIQSIFAIAVGYAIFVFGATIAQETILGGVTYGESSLLTLALAGILTPLAAAIGGAFTAAIAPSRPLLHLCPMGALIAIETTALYATGRVEGPLWFEMSAGLALIGGVFAGGWLAKRIVAARRAVLS